MVVMKREAAIAKQMRDFIVQRAYHRKHSRRRVAGFSLAWKLRERVMIETKPLMKGAEFHCTRSRYNARDGQSRKRDCDSKTLQ